MAEITIQVPDEWAERLAVLTDHGDVASVLLQLADHAQQAVYRPGAWEREWACQAFGYEWTERLEPDTRPEMLSGDGRVIFERPVQQ